MPPRTETAPEAMPTWPIFDQTVSDLRAILIHARREHDAGLGPLTERLGLSGEALAALRDRYLPHMDLPGLDRGAPDIPVDQKSIATLILWRGGVNSEEAGWFAAILARRALETAHLWEDLGLPSRTALSALIKRELPGLAAANVQNMRWKKFFYRQICSDAAFSLCLSPTCDDCDERDDCFAPEHG